MPADWLTSRAARSNDPLTAADSSYRPASQNANPETRGGFLSYTTEPFTIKEPLLWLILFKSFEK